jgi:hypothetical protein
MRSDLCDFSPKFGKQRLNLATFTTKERLSFPEVIHYHIENITHEIFLTGKLRAH